MLTKRVVVCLDVRDGRTTKGVKFADNRDVGDPAEMARAYYEAGADEMVFYDITASTERRKTMLDAVRRVAENIFIPFSVGGGIGDTQDMRAVLLAGAEKVSVNSLAVQRPEIISEGAASFGSQCIVLAIDATRDKAMPSGYRVVIHGGRTPTQLDALDWALKGERLGAGEIVLNAIDTDGMRNGYELTVTRLLSDALTIPLVASGGAGTPDHVVEVLTSGHAHAALVASMVHFGDYTVGQIKQVMADHGVPVRLDYE